MLIEIELKFKLGFSLKIFFLEFRNQVILELDLLEALIVLGVSCSGLFCINFFVFFELDVLLT